MDQDGQGATVGAIDQTKPFTRKAARRAGVHWRALAGPGYTRMFHGVYVCAELTGVESTAAAALLVAKDPDAVASLHTAALLWGGIVPHTSITHVTVPARHTRRRADSLQVHEGTRSTARHRGVPMTSPEDTFVDVARYLSLVDPVVPGDSLVRAGVVSVERLQAAATTATGRSVRLARRAAALVRAGVDSPMESKSRLLMVLAGMPEPTVNHTLREPDGTIRRQLDLAYPHARLAIEYDGRQHAESTKQWQGDVNRREELDGMGWCVIVLLAGDIYRTPQRTIARIRAAMSQCGMAVPEGSEEWKAHFGSGART